MGEKVQPPWRAGQDVRGLAKQVGPEGQFGVGTLQLEGGGHTAEPAEYMDPGFRWARVIFLHTFKPRDLEYVP